MKLSDMKIDLDAKEQGDWVPSPYLPGVRIKARGYGNADHRALMAQQGRDLASIAGSGREVPIDVQDKNELDILLKTILVDWDGITEDDEKTIVPFSADLARQYLSDASLALLKMSVSYAASQNTFKRKAALVIAAKN